MPNAAEAKSTSLPWEIDRPGLPVGSRKRPVIYIQSKARGDTVASLTDYGCADADAELICRAVNAHNALVNARELLIATLESARVSLQRQVLNGTCGSAILTEIDAALKLARGE